jgi:hypothetical protein
MYDTISSNLIRAARRLWYVVAAFVVLGILFSTLVAGGGGRWTASQNVLVAELSTVASLLQLSGIDDVDVRQVAAVVESAFADGQLDNSVSLITRADSLAGILFVEVNAPTQAAALAALDEVRALATSAVIEPRAKEAERTIATLERTLEDFEQRIEDVDGQLTATDAPTRDLALINRIALAEKAAAVELRLSAVETYQEALADELVTSTAPELVRAGVGRTSLLVGVLAGGIVGVLALVGLVLVDRRVRRRLHLERAAPNCSVVAVLPNDDALSSFSGLVTRSVASLCRGHEIERVVVAGLNDVGAASVVHDLILADEIGTELATPVASHEALDVHVLRGACVVLVARSGSTREDQVSTAVATLVGAGALVGVALVGVPHHEMGWAGVSGSSLSDGALAGTK